MAEPVRSILFVEFMGGIGDLLLALPAIHALARTHPAAHLRVLTLSPGHVLLARDPHVAEVVPQASTDGPALHDAVVRQLARGRPDLAVTTNRSHGVPALLERAARRAVTNLWRAPPPDELVDLRYLRLLAAEGVIDPAYAALPPRVVLDPDEVAAARPRIAALPHPPAVLLPDAGMAVKRWPLAHWTRLVSRLAAAGWSPAVLTLHDELAEPLVRAGAPRLPIADLRSAAATFAAAAERSGVAVGGDTGPARLATAAGLRLVGLFGPTLGVRYGVRPRLGVNLQGLPGCPERRPSAITEQVCWWSADCPLSPAGPACMADLGVEAVAAAVG
ncbi:MAG TPA: glycosyltransferase family 9 protein [Mycobacteriales bacterium]|nr:glycosyltransferase family 9 protein [Mycobacteriales bacterium]